MNASEPIRTFVARFEPRLPVGRGRRRRIRYEVQDHLTTLADELQASGLSRVDAERLAPPAP